MDDIGTPGVPDRSRYGYSKQDVRNRGVSGHRYILHNRLLLLCRSALRLSINCRIQEQYGQYDKERDTDSRLPYALPVLLLTGMCLILTFLNQTSILAGAAIWSVIGVSVLTYANSFFIRKVLEPYMEAR